LQQIRTYLEELGCTSVDTNGLTLEEVTFVVSVRLIRGDTLLVA
jgi:hypothetical protein